MQVIDSEGYLKVKLIGGPAGPFVPYTGATTNVDLGTHSLTARNIIVNHPSGSGVAVSITKGGAGEALTVVKTSGSGNAMSVTGGITQLDELHLTTDLADAYIASATTWNNKVPQTRTLTINGTTQDLSADRTFTVSTGITIGTTAITSGTVGRVLFEGTGNVVQESANLFWDNTNNRLGIGSSSPSGLVHLFASANTVLLNFARASNNATKAGWFQVDASDNVVYTSTNGALDFKTNWNGGTQLSTMYLNSNGTVGIGTSTLTTGTPLTIQGASNNGLTIRGNSTSDRYKQFIGNGTTYTADEIFLQAINTNLNILGGATGTTNWLTIKSTGNVLINTTTDAGFKLDVNGTARVQGQITTTTANAQFGTIGASTGEFRVDGVNGAGYAFSVYSSSTLRFGVVGFGGVQMPSGFTITSGSTDLTTTRLRIGTGNSTGAINIMAQSGNTDIVSFKASNGTDQFTIKNTSGNILVGTSTDISSSKLTIQSTTQGFLPPRMTTTQKNAIASPVAGLMVYDTTLNLISVFNGTIWI